VTTTIRSVETFCLRVPRDDGAPTERFRAAPRVRSIYPTADELLLVRIATDDHVGWGEALAPASPEAPGALIDEVFAPFLVGVDIAAGARPLTRRLQQTGRERGHLSGIQADAIAAVDIALWDLFGQVTGLPVKTLLGGANVDAVPVYMSEVNGASAHAKAATAALLYERGMERFKVHLVGPPEIALAEYDVVRSEVGASRLALDAHWVHSAGDARRLARGLDERGAWFLEAPLAPEDLDGHVRLAANSGTSIAIGEAMRHRFEFAQWAGAGAMAIAQPDLGRTGITEAISIATVMGAHHIPLAPHHSMASGIAYAAALHVSAAVDDLLAVEWGPRIAERSNSFLDVSFLEPIGTSGAWIEGGVVAVPAGAGLGIHVDEEAVRRLAAG
jgi:D-galactarolactone cycloisomerase